VPYTPSTSSSEISYDGRGTGPSTEVQIVVEGHRRQFHEIRPEFVTTAKSTSINLASSA
jgi:hypothetical protein